ncbi:3'-phosphoadenosine 5'-phosphosulfate sulfotransferase (PAPS reductase)/FAD synthetase [Fulvimarina manganoxydans]|uniref:3'-phosphoadenosine 5'-phosphosulfate sulfotransferase (PAPS reductase)/FAD synthetase n=1 Tax=Fulvimarina manganoxydans TaxID=937218 RepID=A0A1W2ACF0_9HYPH|nr:phosphoadenosine phosphosulfate reductase family protein [Fulvimarina manganoxydans]SMC58336.1 3'-phosphoadenosine 5'-phosphosulfate sulfotransferase (PAPS reductase)/FAD synthetase [Fulvimarina manganoxydans]
MTQTAFDFGPRQHAVPDQIRDLIASGALFVINHSAGKDSQAMAIVIRSLVPADQILVIHADLGRVEWPGNVEHIRETIGELPLIVCRNENKDFLSMTANRGMFPSPKNRQCTSDLKRGPIHREIARYLHAHPRFGGRVVDCIGLRAEESPGRAKREVLVNDSEREHEAKRTKGTKLSKAAAGREWWTWLPVHGMTIGEVWATIADAGQKRHYAYDLGMSRLSCCFCIMASASDLATAARARPELYREYVELEREIGQTMMMPAKGVKRTLEDVTGIRIDEMRAAA